MPGGVTEPVLTDDDRDAWDVWRRTALVHASTRLHLRRVGRARAAVADALAAAPSWSAMFSCGKDSTAMLALLVDCGWRGDVGSEKDDLDYPGEEDYARDVCARLGLPLSVLRPPVSPRAYLAQHASELLSHDDLHSRAAGLSKACFYDVVEAHGAAYDGIFLGLRAEESYGRRINRRVRGTLYRKSPTPRHPAGQWVSTPLADWAGIDVYAYLLARGIEPLPVYKCLAFAHRHEPWMLRKSWWVPGAHAATGQVAWLRRYYPSLYRQLCDWMPDASSLA